MTVRLSSGERKLLIRGLNEWGGPAHCNEQLAAAMGYDGLSDFEQQQRRMMRSLDHDEPLSRLDWNRALLATEIVFASAVVGGALDWPIATGLSDEETLPLLRGLQLKLRRMLGPLSLDATSNVPPLPMKLMVEYSAPTPLWFPLYSRWINVADLAILNLPDDLASRLRGWQQHFDSHFAVDSMPHWDSHEAQTWHKTEGQLLFQELVSELPMTTMRYDDWPMRLSR